MSFDAQKWLKENAGPYWDHADTYSYDTIKIAEAAYRAGLLRAAEIARARGAAKELENSDPDHNNPVLCGESRSAYSIATAIELEAGNVQKSEEKGD